MADEIPSRAVNRRHVAGTTFGLTLGVLAQAATPRPAGAQASASGTPEARQLAAGISYRMIDRWDVVRLNRILSVDTPAFAGTPVTYTAARHAVRLYRVSYPSVVPEQNNRPVVLSGLVAVPESDQASLPLLSYQHGTVYGKEEVPSFPEQSPETQVMIAQFAAQGYALIGADYIGMGESAAPQGFMVKGSHQQATADLISAARAVLADLGKTASGLFIAGWSQGGYVTMTLLERLEQIGLPVRAAATASAPVDLWVGLNGFLNFPRPIDAPWITTIFILSAFSYENYYGVPGLARSLIRPEHFDVTLRAYRGQAVDPAQIPTNIRSLIDEAYFDPNFFAQSAFGRLTAANHAYRWVVRTPVRNYYGESDEAVSVGLARLAMEFQRALGNDKVEAISTGDTTHRGTFTRAVPHWKQWFDGFPRA
jgi:hypothetical protein